MAGDLRIVASHMPQRRSELVGAQYRHLNLVCPYLLESPRTAWVAPRNTLKLRMNTIRCEHPDCWASYRATEGGSPFGCLICSQNDFSTRVHRDMQGRYRICHTCYLRVSSGLAGTADEVRSQIFARYDWWDTTRRNPKAFRRNRPTQCHRCRRERPVQAHHQDSDRRNDDPSNRAWLCDVCHRLEPHNRTSYRQRNQGRALA